MKDAVATMGTILPEDAGGRDAVHVAVISACSETTVTPGQAVRKMSMKDSDVLVGPTYENDQIGIVDPFLAAPVYPGDRFWLYLMPRTITGLSHQWTHPAFEDAGTTYSPPAGKLASEQWLRDFCQNADCPSYEVVLGKAAEVAAGYNDAFDDDYMLFKGLDAHGEIPPEFWDHVEIVLGWPTQARPKYFTCSC